MSEVQYQMLLTHQKIQHTLHTQAWSIRLVTSTSSTTLIRAETVDRLDMKPHCLVEIGELSFRKSIMIDFTCRSDSFYQFAHYWKH